MEIDPSTPTTLFALSTHDRSRARIARHLKAAGATGPGHATPFEPQQRDDTRTLAAMIADGSVKKAGERLWLDEEVHSQNGRKRFGRAIMVIAVIVVVLILLAFVISAAKSASASTRNAAAVTNDDAAPVVKTTNGKVRGAVAGATIMFRGIPYAAPPVGPRRFEAPQPAVDWAGVRDATRFAPSCPQGKSISEDCLYLNVTTPRQTGAKIPVMVWLHGGGFSAGSPNSYDASELVEQGKVIIVGVEFRVNVFGLFAFPGLKSSGGQILLDQQAALRWVKRNIAAFGGDPDNVTLFGESGGAIGACAQLTSPGARGLFERAILQSGSCSTSFEANFISRGVPAGRYIEPLAHQEEQGLALAKALGCAGADKATMLSCLRCVPAQRLLEAGAAFFSAAYGTPVLPIDPGRALVTGRATPVPVLTGFTRQEGLAMAAGMRLTGAPVTTDAYPPLIADSFGTEATLVKARYPLPQGAASSELAWAAIVTDRMFACPQLRDAAWLARRAPVYLYRFDDPQGVGLVPIPRELPRGPSHSSELPLLFRLSDGPLDIYSGRKIERTPAQSSLSQEMIRVWTSFASTGKPGFGARPMVRLLGASPNTRSLDIVNAEHQCAFWDKLARDQ